MNDIASSNLDLTPLHAPSANPNLISKINTKRRFRMKTHPQMPTQTNRDGPESTFLTMHRWSQLFIPTPREPPADAKVASHKLLLRAGYIRQLGAGIYSYLFLGNRSINKIVAIVREEMNRIGQEFSLPALNPLELWQESGRNAVMGENMF